MKEHTATDESLKTLTTYIHNGLPEVKDRVSIRYIGPYHGELSAQNRVLFKGNRIIIPKS